MLIVIDSKKLSSEEKQKLIKFKNSFVGVFNDSGEMIDYFITLETSKLCIELNSKKFERNENK